MKKFIEMKEEIKNKVNEKIHKEDQEMETTEKKKIPKWLKVTGGAVFGAGALGAAYLFGKSKGSTNSEVDEDYYDEDEDFVEDLDETEEN